MLKDEKLQIEKDSIAQGEKFSLSWAFGWSNMEEDGIETQSEEELEERIHRINETGDDLIQCAVLYNAGKKHLCHTMELLEIEWLEKELLEPIKNNQSAGYFNAYCSSDFEFSATIIDEDYIRLIITDKNNEYAPEIRFDNIISRDDFLEEMNKIFREIKTRIAQLVKIYGQKHNLSSDEQANLKAKLYEWR